MVRIRPSRVAHAACSISTRAPCRPVQREPPATALSRRSAGSRLNGTVIAKAVGAAAITVHLMPGIPAAIIASRWSGPVAIGRGSRRVTILHIVGAAP